MFTSLEKAAFRKFRDMETKKHELRYLFWECTVRCNLNCRHCGSDCTALGSEPDMPLKDFLAALDTIRDPAPDLLVVFTGGEPLLRDDIEEAGLEIRKRGMRWSLVTNGYLYDRRRHNSLLNAGMGALTISLDGLEDSHGWLRNKKLEYFKVLEAIRLAASSPRLNFDVVTCVNSRNLKELDELKEMLIKMGVKAWRLFTITPVGRAAGDTALQLTGDEFLELMEFIRKSREEGTIDVKFSCEGYTGRFEKKVRDGRFFCRAGIHIASVLIDGSISACPNVDRSFVQGNIYRDDFYTVWQTEFEVFRDRRWTRTGTCAHCPEYDDCLGNGLHNRRKKDNELLLCHHHKILEGSPGV